MTWHRGKIVWSQVNWRTLAPKNRFWGRLRDRSGRFWAGLGSCFEVLARLGPGGAANNKYIDAIEHINTSPWTLFASVAILAQAAQTCYKIYIYIYHIFQFRETKYMGRGRES